jgi:hypothetical protein
LTWYSSHNSKSSRFRNYALLLFYLINP